MTDAETEELLTRTLRVTKLSDEECIKLGDGARWEVRGYLDDRVLALDARLSREEVDMRSVMGTIHEPMELRAAKRLVVRQMVKVLREGWPALVVPS